MITILKLAGLSAVLSAGLVTGFSGPEHGQPTGSAKVFYDRLSDGGAPSPVTLAAVDPRALVPADVNTAAKGDRARARHDSPCGDGARRRITADCAPLAHAVPMAAARDGASRTFASR